MGAYTPVPIIKEQTVTNAIQTIMVPAAKAMAEEGRPFTGILYGGLIQTADGPKVIEFNARFGDPETQVLLPRMKSDLVQVILQVMEGKTPDIEWHDEAVLGVVVASKGYPGSYEKGFVLEGLENMGKNVFVYHAGTDKNQAGKFIANGGRLFLAAAKADTLKEAQDKVYEELGKYEWEQTFYRKDIGNKSIKG